MANFHDLDDFTRAYIECALWSSNDESNDSGGNPLEENYDWLDFAPATQEQTIADCKAFQDSNRELLSQVGNPEQNGHDFWLTRNRHGAGFWDRSYGDIGDKLTQACHFWGEVWLYIGDDGLIYC